jgi:hypothetical protein
MPKVIGDKITKDIIMDLNIPFKVYIYLLLIILLVVIIKYFFSKEEIFDFLEKPKEKKIQATKNEDMKLNLLTKLNTKINRDYLDNSKYYHKVGLSKIYGIEKEETKSNLNIKNKRNYKSVIENKYNMSIKKEKKVFFSNIIIYENEKYIN